MHILRIIPSAALMYGAILHTSNALAVIQLDKMMTPDEMKKTGISKLSLQEKQELDNWLNLKFTVKTAERPKDIFLDENINGGAQLKLSDGSVYEIAPTDRSKATYWLTPFQLKLEPSGDPNYPVKITNLVTGVSVKGKKVPSS